VPGLLAAQTHHQVGHIALTSVMKGEGQIQQDLQEQQQRGVRVIVVDAITVDDVDAIAGAVVALNWNVLAVTGRLLNLQEEEQRFGLAHGEAAQNINHGLGSIVREVLNCASGEIKGLYMTGGDTMVNVLKELGATGIEMIDYVIPQTDMVRIIGGDYAGLICVGKGGLTGPEDIISIIVDRIYQEAQQ
ncbi:PTS sugar transporter subunit IIBC, partial [Klebsiella pneumoniae]